MVNTRFTIKHLYSMKKSIQLFLLLPLLIFSACQSNEDPVSVAKESPIFVDQADELHYVLIKVKSIPTESIDGDQNAADLGLTTLRDKVNSIIKEDPEAKLRSSLIFFEKDEKTKDPILVVRRFNNLESANNYRKRLEQKTTDESAIEAILPIAQANYRIVLKEKSLSSYQFYFQKQLSGLIELAPDK